MKRVEDIFNEKRVDLDYFESMIKSEYEIQSKLISIYDREIQFTINNCSFNNVIIRANSFLESNFIDLKKVFNLFHLSDDLPMMIFYNVFEVPSYLQNCKKFIIYIK